MGVAGSDDSPPRVVHKTWYQMEICNPYTRFIYQPRVPNAGSQEQHHAATTRLKHQARSTHVFTSVLAYLTYFGRGAVFVRLVDRWITVAVHSVARVTRSKPKKIRKNRQLEQQRMHARWIFDDPTNMKESCSRDDVGHIQTRSKNTIEYQASRKQPWETMHFARDAQTAVSEHTDGQLVHQAMSEEVPASARLQQPATRTRRRKALTHPSAGSLTGSTYPWLPRHLLSLTTKPLAIMISASTRGERDTCCL